MSHDDLVHLYSKAAFDIVCANLESLTEEIPVWLQTSVQKESIQGIRVGFIGLTAPFNDFYELLDWHVASPFAALDHYIDELANSCDIIVLLSHLGIGTDEEIARRYEEIDVIIGGHTHHLLRTGEMINHTLITAAGKQCQYVGEVKLMWDHQKEKLIEKQAHTTDISHLPKDLSTVQKLNELAEDAHRILAVPIGYTPRRLQARWFANTDLMQKLTRTLREWTHADIAMLNAGLILDDLPPGSISYEDIHGICPHPINPCVVVLTGEAFIHVVRASLARPLTELKLKGFGFRGEVIGKMIYSGIELETTKTQSGEEQLEQIYFHGEPIKLKSLYYVAVPDTFTFGSLLPEIAQADVKQFFVPELLRDLLVMALKPSENT